jgi:hypothetical protein
MEPNRSDPRPLQNHPPEVHQVEGMLSVRLGVTVDEATQILEDRAVAGGITVLDAAIAVLRDHGRRCRGELVDPWGSC